MALRSEMVLKKQLSLLVLFSYLEKSVRRIYTLKTFNSLQERKTTNF